MPRGLWLTGDTAAFSETYSTKNVGTGMTLAAGGSVNDGNSGSNYTVTFNTGTGGSITARAITVTAAATTKSYDGSTSSATAPTVTSGSLVGSDTPAFSETFSTKNVGTGLTLTAGGSVNDGNSGSDYTVTFATSATGSITPQAITVTALSSSKSYDGSNSSLATPTVTSGTLLGGDTAAFSETYDTKNVGSDKILTATGSVNDGNGGSNYTVSFNTSNMGLITLRLITVTASATTKVLRRLDNLDRDALDHFRQPGRRRHGRLQRDFRHKACRHGQDAHRDRLRQRRRRR